MTEAIIISLVCLVLALITEIRFIHTKKHCGDQLHGAIRKVQAINAMKSVQLNGHAKQ